MQLHYGACCEFHISQDLCEKLQTIGKHPERHTSVKAVQLSTFVSLIGEDV